MADRFAQPGTAGEIALATGIAPRAVRVPMPGLDEEFRVLTIGRRAPSRRQNLLDRVGIDELIDRACGEAVDPGAECLVRDKCIGGVRRRGIYTDQYRRRLRECRTC